MKYQHDIVGVNSRLDELQAAVLRVKLPCLDAENAARAAAAAAYIEALGPAPLQLPHVPAGIEPAWHLFVVATPERDALQAHLRAQEIGTLVHYPMACHQQGAYRNHAWPSLPLAERLQSQVLSLPMAPYLTPADVQAVAAALCAGLS